MIVSRTLDFFETQIQSAREDLEKYFLDPQVEVLHRFRVELKKIRSVLFLLEEIKGSNKIKKSHQQVKHIFRKGGEIRELQLEIDWLGRHRKFDLMRLMLYDVKLKKADRSFHHEIPAMLRVLKKISRKTKHSLSVLTQDETNVYISRKWKLVLTAILSDIKESNWHEARKGIKQLVYAWQWIPEYVPLPKQVIKIFKALDKLQNTIGRWHDLDLLGNKLQRIGTKIAGHAILQREQQLALKKLIAEREILSSRIKDAFGKINKMIRDYN
jgi:CHAD domain-containing protein